MWAVGVLAGQTGSAAGELDAAEDLPRVVAEHVDRSTDHLADRPVAPRVHPDDRGHERPVVCCPPRRCPTTAAVHPIPTSRPGGTEASDDGPAQSPCRSPTTTRPGPARRLRREAGGARPVRSHAPRSGPSPRRPPPSGRRCRGRPRRRTPRPTCAAVLTPWPPRSSPPGSASPSSSSTGCPPPPPSGGADETERASTSPGHRGRTAARGRRARPGAGRSSRTPRDPLALRRSCTWRTTSRASPRRRRSSSRVRSSATTSAPSRETAKPGWDLTRSSTSSATELDRTVVELDGHRLRRRTSAPPRPPPSTVPIADAELLDLRVRGAVRAPGSWGPTRRRGRRRARRSARSRRR